MNELYNAAADLLESDDPEGAARHIAAILQIEPGHPFARMLKEKIDALREGDVEDMNEDHGDTEKS